MNCVEDELKNTAGFVYRTFSANISIDKMEVIEHAPVTVSPP